MNRVIKTLWEFPKQVKLLFLLRFLKSLTESGLTLVFMIYMMEHLSFTMEQSNLIYTAWNVLGATWAIPIGWFVDHGSLKDNLVVGATLNCVGKIMTFADHSKEMSLFGVLLFSNVGIEFVDKVLSVSLSRMIPLEKDYERNTAFQFGYAIENIGVAAAFFFTDYATNSQENGIELILLFSVAFSLVFVLFSCLFVGPEPCNTGETRTIFPVLRQVISDRAFWRLVMFGFALVGVSVFWNYNLALFPIYMKYEINSTHYGNVESINPMFIPLFTAIVGALFPRANPYNMVIYGTVILALSAMPLVFYSTMNAAELYVFLMTIGEAVYSPKVELVEFNIAPPQLAGLYTSLTKIPVGIFRVIGMLSNSFLIDDMCSDGVKDRCSEIWATAVAIALTTPVLLLCLGKFILTGPVASIVDVSNVGLQGANPTPGSAGASESTEESGLEIQGEEKAERA